MSRWRRSVVASAVVAIALVATSCGVATEDRPKRIDRDDVPFQLLEDATRTPGSPAGTPASSSP